jgi:hypothetical protein
MLRGQNMGDANSCLARLGAVAFVSTSACVPNVTFATDASPPEGDGHAPRHESGSDVAASDAKDAVSDADSGTNCLLSASTGPSVFVVDSTSNLFEYDGMGVNTRPSTIIPTVSELNGGGVTYGFGLIFVTTPHGLVAFDLDLGTEGFAGGSFAELSVPRGIAYDCSNQALYIANSEVYGVVAYNISGGPIPISGKFPSQHSPSGIAYDADDKTLWVANYAGTPVTGVPDYGVAEYTAQGAAARAFDYATQFVAPPHDEPYSITVCTKGGSGGATLVVVGFIDDTSGLGSGAVQAFTVDGASRGPPLMFSKPLALSCSSRGRLYIGDESGLYVYDLGGGTPKGVDGGPSAFYGVTPPILGVFAAN